MHRLRACRRWLGRVLVVVLLVALGGCGSVSRSQGQRTITGDGWTITANLPPLPAPKPTTSATRTTSTQATATTGPTTAQTQQALKPPIVADLIPFGSQRKAEMAAYAKRHYGIDSYLLSNPHVIVIHYTETPDFQSTFNTFASDTPDSELHELPNTCAHFVIDQNGVIHQLVALNLMCRHTVGLNYTAIGVEHVGNSDQQVLNNTRELNSSLRLVRWLSCQYNIQISNVIGHNESLSSPYHHENVAALQTQTHNDFNRADMNIYRARLNATGSCG